MHEEIDGGKNQTTRRPGSLTFSAVEKVGHTDGPVHLNLLPTLYRNFSIFTNFFRDTFSLVK